jgi:hypothetical protein
MIESACFIGRYLYFLYMSVDGLAHPTDLLYDLFVARKTTNELVAQYKSVGDVVQQVVQLVRVVDFRCYCWMRCCRLRIDHNLCVERHCLQELL